MFGFYTRFFRSQVENTLTFRLILRACFKESVEKFCICLWKILWKTLRSIFIKRFKIRGIFVLKNSSCVKHEISARKKILNRKKIEKKSKFFL